MRAVVLCRSLLFGVVGGSLRAQSPTPVKLPVRILFVGNSFTHGKYLPVRTYNAAAVIDENTGLPADDPRAFHPAGEDGPFGGIPGIFKKLTDEAGLNYEVHIEAVSAKNLAFHYEHALSVIARPGWDVVVLQGYSTEPLPAARGGKPKSFVENARRLEEAIHAANPHAKVYLEQTWPRADLIYPEGSPYYGTSTSMMTSNLLDTCLDAQGKGSFEYMDARVGDTWQDAIREGVAEANPYRPAKLGELDLWGPDNYHPSIYGAYLSALVLFSDIVRVNPTTLNVDEQAARELGISPADAVRLQRIGTRVAHPPKLPAHAAKG